MQREKLIHSEVTAETLASHGGNFGAEMPSQLSKIVARGWILDVCLSQSLARDHPLDRNMTLTEQFHATKGYSYRSGRSQSSQLHLPRYPQPKSQEPIPFLVRPRHWLRTARP